MFDPAHITAHPWLIVGCGYTGARLARRLVASGATVYATRRDASDARALAGELGVNARGCDLDRPEEVTALTSWVPHGALWIDSAPPSATSPEAERRLVLAALAARAERLVYISSTGVYPPGDGSWMDEDTPPLPEAGHGEARLAAESALLDKARLAGIRAISLRAVGIYGPGRGVAARLLAGDYRVIGAGNTYVNRIHVDDLVTAVMAAALIQGPTRDIYNVSDDLPETSREHADRVADVLGVPRPPSVPESQVSPRVVAMLGANRRIANECMKHELGVTLAYPTWREGLAQIIEEDKLPTAKPVPKAGE